MTASYDPACAECARPKQTWRQALRELLCLHHMVANPDAWVLRCHKCGLVEAAGMDL